MSAEKDKMDDIEAALQREEQSRTGEMLRSAGEKIEPRPEFARQLESRLLSAARAQNVQAQASSETMQATEAPIVPRSLRQILPSPNRRTGFGRFASLAVGALGAAALALLFIGMAMLIRARQGGDPTETTPVAESLVPADSLAMAGKLAPIRRLPMERAYSMAWSPDGHTLAAIEWPGEKGSDISRPLWREDKVQLKLWDTASGQLLGDEAYGYSGLLKWSPDGGKLVIGAAEQTVHVLDRTGRKLYTVKNQVSPEQMPEGSEAALQYGMGYVSWSPDGQSFLISGEQLTLDPRTYEAIVRIRDASTGEIKTTYRLPAVPTATPVPDRPEEYRAPSWSLWLEYSPDGSKILVGAQPDTAARVIDSANGNELFRLHGMPVELEETSYFRYFEPNFANWSPDSHFLYSFMGPVTRIYSGSTGEFVRMLPETVPPDPVPSVVAPPPGATPLPPADPSERWYIEAGAWSPGRQVLATAALMKMWVWDVSTGTKLHTQNIAGTNSIAWSPDGNVLVFLNGGADEGRINNGAVVFLDANTWEQISVIPPPGQPMTSDANAFTWSPDGRMIAVSGKQGIVLWGVPEPGHEPTEGFPVPSPEGTTLPVPEVTAFPTEPANTPSIPTGVHTSQPTSEATIAGTQPPGFPSATSLPTSTPPCGTWEIVPAPKVGTVNELLAVDALAADDVWAVGYHSDGTPDYVEGTPLWPGGRAQLTPVPGSERPLTMHWDGQSWKPVAAPEVGEGNSRLTGVAAIAPDDVWAVGYNDGSEHDENRPDKSRTLIMHWNGAEWRVIPTQNLDVEGVNNRLYDVTALASDNVWAVGHTGGGYDFDLSRPDAPIGRTLILHWDGRKWSRVPSPNPASYGNQLFGISAVTSDDIWAIGTLFANEQTPSGADSVINPLMLHWNGKEWLNVPIPEASSNSPSYSPSYSPSIVTIAQDDVWAVSSVLWNAPISMHWDGSQWTSVEVPIPNSGREPSAPAKFLMGVDALSSNNVWAVGYYWIDEPYQMRPETLIMHWDGVRWSQARSPNGDLPKFVLPSGFEPRRTVHNRLNGVSALPSGEVWAVGSTVGITSMAGVNPYSNPLILRFTPPPCPNP
jgi:hypothetical protein